jgi:hypothetical protein
VAWFDPWELFMQQRRPEQHAELRQDPPLPAHAAPVQTIAGWVSSGQTTVDAALTQLFWQWLQQRSPVEHTAVPHCTGPPSWPPGGQSAVTQAPFWHSQWAQATVPLEHCMQIWGNAPLHSVASVQPPASEPPLELPLLVEG